MPIPEFPRSRCPIIGCPPFGTGTKPSSKSVRHCCAGFARSKSSGAVDPHASAREYTLNGLPDQSTTSAFLPTSSEPILSSSPSAHAGIDRHPLDRLVLGTCECRSLARRPSPSRPPGSAAAMPDGSSECTIARAPARCTSAMFARTPSIASILKPPQSDQIDAEIAFAREQVGDLVRLDAVVERADLVAELLRDVDHLRHLVGAIAVVVHEDVAAQHLGERLAARGRAAARRP